MYVAGWEILRVRSVQEVYEPPNTPIQYRIQATAAKWNMLDRYLLQLNFA